MIDIFEIFYKEEIHVSTYIYNFTNHVYVIIYEIKVTT